MINNLILFNVSKIRPSFLTWKKNPTINVCSMKYNRWFYSLSLEDFFGVLSKRHPWWLIFFFSITMCSVKFWSKFYVFRQYSIFFWLIKIIMFFMHNLTWQKVVLKYTWRRSFSHFRFSLASSILLSLSDTDNYYWYLQLSIHFWF